MSLNNLWKKDMELYPHQKEFVSKKLRKVILSWGTRVGKTLTIVEWSKIWGDVFFFLVCPKKLKGQWEEELSKNGICNIVVYTKEEVKKIDLSIFSGMIVDEAHWVASGLYSPHKTSEITLKLFNWVRQNMEAPAMLATATPVSSSPANLHTLLALTGRFINIDAWISKFYEPNSRYIKKLGKDGKVKRIQIKTVEPKQNWRELLAPIKAKHCHNLKLSDIVELPPQTHTVIDIKLKEETKNKIKLVASLNPSADWHAKHLLAQFEEKLEKIRELSDGIDRVIIICERKEQIRYYEDQLSKEREVVVLDGDTKDQAGAIKKAQEMTEGYFILQADSGEGFSGHMFSMMIFASMSWRYTSYAQSIGRTHHLEKRTANDYIYLLACEQDKSVYGTIIEGRDFDLSGSYGL
jgi:hypothetical protein